MWEPLELSPSATYFGTLGSNLHYLNKGKDSYEQLSVESRQWTSYLLIISLSYFLWLNPLDNCPTHFSLSLPWISKELESNLQFKSLMLYTHMQMHTKRKKETLKLGKQVNLYTILLLQKINFILIPCLMIYKI